jgi:predicted phosphodiesterase
MAQKNMKVGVISDIHANPYGLETALKYFDSIKVDHILCAGDLTGYSPLVNETLEILLSRSIEFILGNHDYYLLNECPTSKSLIVKSSVYFTKQIIKPEFLEFIRKLQPVRLMKLEGFVVKMAHGSPSNALEEYIYPDRKIDIERVWFDSEKLLILGHTHHQMLKEFDEFKILNPGSCGQPRDGRGQSCFAVFDTATGSVELKRHYYDTRGIISALNKEHWPTELLSYF